MAHYDILFVTSPTEQLPLLRNRFTKEILANNKEKKPIPPSLCNAPSKNFETHFISDEMLEDIPHHQVTFFAIHVFDIKVASVIFQYQITVTKFWIRIYTIFVDSFSILSQLMTSGVLLCVFCHIIV